MRYTVNLVKKSTSFHKNFHRAIIENLYDYSVFTTDNKGIIKSWNVGAETLFGYKEAEMLGKNCSLTFTLEDRKNKIPEGELHDAIKKSKTMEERFHPRKDGSLFWASGITFPIEDEKNVHTGFTKIMHDISAQKEFEDRKDEFISTATHEIRTPITTMKLFADIVKNKTKKINSTSLNDSVTGLNDQIDRLIALTNYLLDVSKIQGGKLKITKRYFDINNQIRILTASMNSGSPKHVFVKQGNLKDKVYGDPERINQVLTNLISNAVKYSSRGQKIIIKTSQEKNSSVISIQDFGLGISKADQKKLFTRFFRAKTSHKKNIPGIGLGLYISKKIIHEHGGELTITSKLRSGTTFHFNLPHKVPHKALIKK